MNLLRVTQRNQKVVKKIEYIAFLSFHVPFTWSIAARQDLIEWSSVNLLPHHLNTSFYNGTAKGQSRSVWIGDSSLLKHIEHCDDKRLTPLLISDCLDAILSIDALHPKHPTLRGTHCDHESGAKSIGARFDSRISLKRFLFFSSFILTKYTL